jgi:thymidylate synthase
MGLNDLEKYVQELIYGVHDHYLEDVNNPNRWKYTYHDRLFNHPTGGNQIARMVSQLATCPHTRRAQAITWEAKGDPDLDDPPCLQSIWCRIVDNRLHMNVRFRSRDLFKAAFPNMVALTELQRKMAQAVSLLLGRLVLVGDYVDISDSAHLYGKDFKEIEGALAQWKLKPNLAQRTWTTTQALSCFIDGCDELLAESAVPKTRQVLVQLRRQEFVDLSVAKQSIVQS